MKIVETPPKTGEEFIVAWFDDGEANSHHYRYSEEHQMFERMSSASTYLSFTEKSINLLCKDSLIIIEG